jgi:hypothetical protein
MPTSESQVQLFTLPKSTDLLSVALGNFAISTQAFTANDHDVQDRIAFNPANLAVIEVGGRWKVAEVAHWLLDFGPGHGNAVAALHFIRKYGFNEMCFVGRPGPSMTYFKRRRGSLDHPHIMEESRSGRYPHRSLRAPADERPRQVELMRLLGREIDRVSIDAPEGASLVQITFPGHTRGGEPSKRSKRAQKRSTRSSRRR